MFTHYVLKALYANFNISVIFVSVSIDLYFLRCVVSHFLASCLSTNICLDKWMPSCESIDFVVFLSIMLSFVLVGSLCTEDQFYPFQVCFWALLWQFQGSPHSRAGVVLLSVEVDLLGSVEHLSCSAWCLHCGWLASDIFQHQAPLDSPLSHNCPTAVPQPLGQGMQRLALHRCSVVFGQGLRETPL